MNTAAGDNFEKLDESYEGQQIELSQLAYQIRNSSRMQQATPEGKMEEVDLRSKQFKVGKKHQGSRRQSINAQGTMKQASKHADEEMKLKYTVF